jgi:transcriptional regulator with XRE-family HTH domain|nr:MAG TPA: antidote protein [Caudoviricetes sp.]
MNENMYERIMRNLKMILQDRGKQAELSAITGIAAPNLSRWYTGERNNPTLKNVGAVFDAVGVKVIFPWEVEGDFSKDIDAKNKRIHELEISMEKLSQENLRLEGENRLAQKQIENLTNEKIDLLIKIRQMSKENPAQGGE